MTDIACAVAHARKVARTDFYKPTRTLIHDVNLTVKAGTIHGFVGHNGAGKSTTLKLLIGAARPTSGTVTVFGASPLDTDVRMRLGYLPELPRLPESLTPRELLLAHATLSRMPPDARRARADALLARIEMADLADQRLGTFSKGMQQRVAIAVTLVADPDLAILDEPMSGLDPAGRRLVRELIMEHQGRGKSVLLSSHVLPDVEALCDEVTIVHHGNTVASGPLDTLLGSAEESEVVFACTDDAVLEHARSLGEVQRAGAAWVLGVPGPTRDAMKRASELEGHGAEIIEVRRAMRHLEDELLRLVGEGGKDPRREAAA